jgi:hypothetical protein
VIVIGAARPGAWKASTLRPVAIQRVTSLACRAATAWWRARISSTESSRSAVTSTSEAN